MDYQPAWLTDEVYTLLNRIGGNDQRKKRTTVLRLAEAYATGKTEASVWQQSGCCSWKTWDGKHRKDADGVSRKRPGWRDDPAIQAALEAATRRAHWWQDQAEARRIGKRQENVALAQDLLAEYAPKAASRLAGLLDADSETVARHAANDILDRADEATASKGGVHIDWRQTAADEGFDPDALVDQIAAILARGDGATDGGGSGEGEGAATGDA